MRKKSGAAFWALVKSNPKAFARHAFRDIYPGKDFLDNWHIDAMLHALQEAIAGRQPRLIINLPPRAMKSFLVSVVLPAFILGNDPTAKIVCVSYSEDLARVHARDCRRIMDSDWYRKLFGLQITKMTETEVTTYEGGSRYAISLGGSLTGRGADFIIVDDPIKPEDAQSDRARKSCIDGFNSTLFSRLDDKGRSVLIVVMQRLHIDDLSGYLQQVGGYHTLALPAIATKDERVRIGPQRHHTRVEGDVLNPQHETREDLAMLRRQLGSYNYAAQYQQDPELAEGNLFKLHYIKVIDRLPKMKSSGMMWLSIDAAASTSQTADYSAMTLGYSDETGHYLLDALRGQWDFESLLQKSLKVHELHAHRAWRFQFIVENASNGIALISSLQRRGLAVVSSNPGAGKEARAIRAVPIFQEGRVFFVEQPGHKKAWYKTLVNELLRFPYGRYDDLADSVTMMIAWMDRRVGRERDW